MASTVRGARGARRLSTLRYRRLNERLWRRRTDRPEPVLLLLATRERSPHAEPGRGRTESMTTETPASAESTDEAVATSPISVNGGETAATKPDDHVDARRREEQWRIPQL